MKITTTPLAGLLVLEPNVFRDERGYFFESYNQKALEAAVGRSLTFVQDNHSKSHRGVLRGLHYQLAPHAQGKLVRVVCGKVWDVAVDLRRSSPTFGQWFGEYLSGENKRQMWIPEGFAHGFVVLSEEAEFLYKTTDYWDKDSERSIAWNDYSIGIDWPLVEEPILSAKDAAAPHIGEAEVFA